MRKTTKKTSQTAKQKSRSRRSPSETSIPVKVVTPKGLLALSTEYGVFVAMSTPLEAAMLADFRLAAKDPFPRVIAAPAKRCRVSVGEWRDEKMATTERLYLAFIPTPEGAVVEGHILYGVKAGRQQQFISVTSQRFDTLNAEKKLKILYALQPRFAEIIDECLPAGHALRDQLGKVSTLRRDQDAWRMTQARIRGHLERKDGRAALRELEPLVYTAKPKAPAEKLLSEMLLKAHQKEQAPPTDSVLAALKSESLMLSYLLGRLSRKADRKAVPSPTD